MAAGDHEGWSFAGPRVPARFTAAIHPRSPDVEHALGEHETLCGVVRGQVEAYRHLFNPDDTSACPACRRLALAAPSQPSGQQRLHDLVMAADEGRMREELLGALRQGAEIRLWLTGPASDLARYYVPLDRVVEGASAVVAALDNAERIGVAIVAYGRWEFVVVLPLDAPPLIARRRRPIDDAG